MKTYSYNKELLLATAQMKMIFDNITIKRDNCDIIVPCVFGQRSRILKFLQNPEGSTFKLPMSTITRGEISYDSSRSSNIHSNVLKQSDYSIYDPNSIQPVPINITYKVTFITKYPNDMEMLLSNFIPFFHKDIFVTSPHPKLKNRAINHQIIWSGSIDTAWPDELTNTENDIQICNTSFTYKTEIFGGSGFLQDPTGIIYTIDLTLSPTTSNISDSYSTSGNNLLGGFYPVPYAENFDNYINKILDISRVDYIEDPDRDELLYNTWNDSFNNGVLSNSVSALSAAVTSGADIYKTSYWPLAYAKYKNYDDVVTYIRSLSGLER